MLLHLHYKKRKATIFKITHFSKFSVTRMDRRLHKGEEQIDMLEEQTKEFFDF